MVEPKDGNKYLKMTTFFSESTSNLFHEILLITLQQIPHTCLLQ